LRKTHGGHGDSENGSIDSELNVVFGHAEFGFITREWENRHISQKCVDALEGHVVGGVVGGVVRTSIKIHLTQDAMSTGDDLFLGSVDDDTSAEQQVYEDDVMGAYQVPTTHTGRSDVLLRSVHFVHSLRTGLLRAYQNKNAENAEEEGSMTTTTPPDEIEVLEQIFTQFTHTWPRPPTKQGMDDLIFIKSLLDPHCHDEVKLCYDHVQNARICERLLISMGEGGAAGKVGSFNAASINVSSMIDAVNAAYGIEREMRTDALASLLLRCEKILEIRKIL
jgi:hypothetical protein